MKNNVPMALKWLPKISPLFTAGATQAYARLTQHIEVISTSAQEDKPRDDSPASSDADNPSVSDTKISRAKVVIARYA